MSNNLNNLNNLNNPNQKNYVNQGNLVKYNQVYLNQNNQGNQGNLTKFNQIYPNQNNQGNLAKSNQVYPNQNNQSNQGNLAKSNQKYPNQSNQGNLAKSNQKYPNQSNQGNLAKSNQVYPNQNNQGNQGNQNNQGNQGNQNNQGNQGNQNNQGNQGNQNNQGNQGNQNNQGNSANQGNLAKSNQSNPSQGNVAKSNQSNSGQGNLSQGNPSQGNVAKSNQSNSGQGNLSQGNPSQGNVAKSNQSNSGQGNVAKFSYVNPSQNNLNLIIKTMVLAVTTSNTSLIPTNLADKVIGQTPYDPNKEINNPKTELINHVTSFVTEEFFKKDETRLYFFAVVYDVIDIAITYYKLEKKLKLDDILFVYKGGNILRIIYNNYIKKLSKCARDLLSKNFDENFKKSDFDFNLFINPNINNWDQVNNDIKQIIFLALNLLRGIIAKEYFYIMDYFSYIDEEKKRLLDKLMNKLNESEILKKTDSPYLGGKITGIILGNLSSGDIDNNSASYVKKDMIIKKEKGLELTENIVTYEIDKITNEPELYPHDNKYFDIYTKYLNLLSTHKFYNDSFMYVSINDKLSFNTNQGNLIQFDLLRLKSNFRINIKLDDKDSKTNLGGEMIDIGISYIDEHLKHFFSHQDDVLNIYEYEIPKIATDRNFKIGGKFLGYSLNYSISDLEYILLDNAIFPWSSVKYEKRLKRLIFLYFLSMLNNLNKITQVKSIINSIIKYFDNENPHLKPDELNGLSINKLINKNNQLKNTFKDEIEYQKFIGITSGLLKDIFKAITIIENEIETQNKIQYTDAKNPALDTDIGKINIVGGQWL